jgi:hypothetical protein
VLFEKMEEEAQWIDEAGFLLPEGYRFNDNEYERQPYRKKE